uniref:DUF975 family protein n=1 Tax=Roseburia sp. TaxID=2049040 RepID=UPI003FEEDFB4
MWTRKDLKTKAKERMSLNYWRSVLVALILTAVAGGGAASAAGAFGGGSDSSSISDEIRYTLSDNGDDEDSASDALDSFEEMMNDDFYLDDGVDDFIAIVLIVVAIALVVVLIATVIAVLLRVFLLQPLEVGCKRFFTRNLDDNAQVKEVCFSYDHNYMNSVKIMFFKGLYTFLWTLLFVIPGIIKSYEYKQVPYILAENPDITKEEAFARSKQMMSGNKWKAFVLDLSFLGWEILNTMTIGILGIFYVKPYEYQTEAAFYEALKQETMNLEASENLLQ